VDLRIRELLDLAFRTEPGASANEVIAEVRAGSGQDGGPVRAYELMLPPEADLDWLAQTALPRLVYHLESVRARSPSFDGTVVAAFAGDRLFFVRAADFLPAAATLLGTSVADLYAQHGTREARTAVTAGSQPPLALPPPPK